MKERIAIVSLCRYGDIVSVLPIAYDLAREGHEVDFHVHIQFKSILDSIGYVKCVPYHGLHRDVDGCANQCRKYGSYNRVLALQENGNGEHPPFTTENFISQPWARAGYLERFHDIPLVFDRRDLTAEATAAKRAPRKDGRPLLVYCLGGHSSPMKQANEFREWLVGTFSESHRLVDITELRLPKPQELIGILEVADRLLTTDSFPLHLAYATMTPTIALQPDHIQYKDNYLWQQSEPRKHWIEKLTYTEAMSPEGHSKIIEAMEHVQPQLGKFCRKLQDVRRDRIVHVVDWDLPEGNNDRRRRMLAAHRTWSVCKDADRHYLLLTLDTNRAKRTSRTTISDTRDLPYIRDIIQVGMNEAGENDIVILTNSDICLVPEAVQTLRLKMIGQECCFSRRVDVNRADAPKKQREISNMPLHCGADFFAFRKSWWVAHEGDFPDLLMACEGWDFVLRHMMLDSRSDAEIKPPLIYHESHSSFWSEPNAIFNNPGQIHNRRLCKQWALENGFSDALREKARDGLFEIDGRFKRRQMPIGRTSLESAVTVGAR